MISDSLLKLQHLTLLGVSHKCLSHLSFSIIIETKKKKKTFHLYRALFLFIFPFFFLFDEVYLFFLRKFPWGFSPHPLFNSRSGNQRVLFRLKQSQIIIKYAGLPFMSHTLEESNFRFSTMA